MLNRPTAQAESQDLNRGLEAKATRRPWNPALHPRDSKGRFIETGGVVRLWGGKLARVVRALPHDRILVQDQSAPNEFRGRRHTTSAKWVSMVARPDGSAPTDNEDKVAEEDEKRRQDARRGNGVARDDDGDPDTPNDPHDVDDRGRPIGDDDGDGPDDDDDQDEPEDGAHPVNVDALPNQQHAAGARHKDTAAVRRHFTQLAEQPGTSPDMATFLRSVAYDDDLQTTPSGRLAILRDERNGRFYLTATGTGQRVDAAGDFGTAQDAARFAEHLDKSAVNGQITKFNQPFDFSDPQADNAARGWRSTKGENIQGAIQRARREFDGAAPAPAAAPKPSTPRPAADSNPEAGGQRFSTMQAVRAHWQDGLAHARRKAPGSVRMQRAAENLDALIKNDRLKLVGRGQFVVGQDHNGEWFLIATGTAAKVRHRWTSQRDAQAFAESFVQNAPMGDNGKPLDLSDPKTSLQAWRSDDNRSIHEVLEAAAEKFQGDNTAPDNVDQPSARAQSPAPEDAPEAPEEPQTPALPDDAEPVDGVDGYHYTSDGGAVTVYGPDGQVAVTSERGYPPKANIDGVTVPVPQYPRQGAAVMARLHRAAQNPGERDRITAAWVMKPGKNGQPAKRVMVFRGTVKGDQRDYDAVGSTRAIKWAPSLSAYSTQSNMTTATRDERISEVLGNLARQGRNIHVTDETGAGAPNAPANAGDEADVLRRAMVDADDARLQQMKNERWAKVSRSRNEGARRTLNAEIKLIDEELDRRRKERDEAAARDATSLSDADIQARISQSQQERGTYGARRGEEANDIERAIYGERRRRSQALVDDDTDLTTMAEEDLAKARERTAARVTMHQGAGDDHEAEQTLRQALQKRHDEIVGEQQRRRAEQIADRPAVADLTDDELSEEYNDLLRRDFRKAPPEAQRVLEGRLEDVKRERRERETRAITDRDGPENLTDEKLAEEYAELRRTGTSYEPDEVKKARRERLAVLEAEQNRRDTTPEVEQLLARVDNPDSNGAISINGGNGYGYIDYNATTGTARKKVGWTWGKHSWGHPATVYTSRAAALAAMVRAYDTDPDTRGERTWGPNVRVFVPKMFVELYRAERLGDRLDGASQERQYLYGLFQGGYGWDDGVNPLVPSNKKGHHIKGRNLSVPQGLLAELNRVTEELSREMSLRATDREADSSDRSKAKTRLASINAALHVIEGARVAVRNNGGNDDQKVISREEIEAQQAALRAALGGDDDEHVQPDGSGALGDAPAQGVGGDGRPGGVRDGEGQGDRDGDSDGGAGAGGDGAGTGRVRGSGGPAQADQGGRDGDGPARAAAGAGAGSGSRAGGVADGAAPAGDQGPGVRPVARFRPDPAGAPKNTRARAIANVEAIKVLKTLEAENRPATDAEKRILARWSGWGSAPILFATEPKEKEPRYQQGGAREGKFDHDHARWSEYSDVRDELQRVLTPVQFRHASRGVLSMHYTPQPIAEAMWDGLRAFGFDRGDVLEAGSGAGTFFGVAPDGARLTGIELDPTTARIAQAIYPHANVLNESFAETDAHPGTFDAAIGNVPFADIPFDDKRYAAETLHNGFITKELALTRPGGITLLITSKGTLDSKGDKARKKMAQYGDLLGAVRLPSGVFNDAGTGVTTDVLVFRRREDGTEPADTSWLNASERDVNGTTLRVNDYYTAHPEHILGELTTESSPYGPRLTVKGDPAKAAEQLRAVLEDIAAKAKADGRGYEPHPDGDNRPPVQLQTAREKHANDWSGRLYEGDDGQFYQHVNGADPVLIDPADGNTAQLRDLMQLRDVAAELRELDRKNDEEERAEALRAQLRDLHAAYVAAYGPLSKPGQHRSKGGRPTAWGYFRADPDAAAVLALERWDADTEQPVLSRVFTERAAARRQPLSSTDDPKAALAAVVAAKGEVDLGEIARLLDVDPQEALKRLGNEVFTDPATGRVELAGAYLSGAVRDKLDVARKAAETDPAFAVNVAALEAVQPPERTIGQFTPEMGAHWTPPELLQGFLREYLGDRTLRVAHDDRYGWILNTGRVPEANNVMYGVPADPEKGTKGKNAVEIARAILGFGSLTVYKDDKRKEVDEVTSRLIRQKADQMRAEFAKYATANAERLSTLTESYNRIMNGHIVRSYEGMSPTLEGFTPDRNPNPWQNAGAARMQFERGVILAHEVGLGKTTTLVMGTQALKASGQVEKPMAVVPNHLAKQWADEARFLYPNADIHLITSADLAGERRNSTLEWLRANKPDLVIFTEEAFGSIKMSPEAQDDYEFRELEALREQLDRQYEDADNPNHPFIVAKIEQRIATVQRNMGKNAAPMRTPGALYWDDLGFDYFVVDEAHRYKGVGFRSKEAGGDPASIRGVDLHQKTTDLHRRRAGRAAITLATGTPLSNSISEQFTMLQFAAPWVLDSYKAGAPDLWANTFGRKTLRFENAPDGSGIRIVERFSEFHNKRAMKTMWGLVADTKRADDVGIPRPKVKGGGHNLILVDATPDQKKRLKGLVARGRAIHSGEPQQIRTRKGTLAEDNMLTVSNEGTSVALDPRLIDGDAPAGNKLKAVAARAVERYHATKDRVYKVAYGSDEDHPVPGALQMLFLNEGVPGSDNKGGFDAYAELKKLMVAGGVPADKIAFVQDAKKSGKPEDMTELFRKARDGEIAVLIGSSATAGTGMNAQNRMISLTHVDLDWGAAQMEQRNGRILRYGNQNPEVEIDVFGTKGSMDGWKAGFVAAKAEGLVDIQRPEPEDGDTSDVVQEIDGAEFDYETMEAEMGGNPYMSQLMKERRRLKDLEIDQHNEAAERVRRAEALTKLRQEAQDTRDGIQRREAALPRIQPADDQFRMTIGRSPYGERSDAGKALHREITARLLEHDREGMGPGHTIGQFRGLDFEVRAERDANGKLIAHIGFPDLRNSHFTRSVEDLQKKNAGSGIITRLGNALDKAPALQESDRARVPELDEDIALLQSAHAAADLTPQIDHARQRSNMLEEIVARITNLDAKPEIDPDELDKDRYKRKDDREKIAKARREEREPLQTAVDEAVAALQQWDRENPAPEQEDTVRLSEEEVQETLARIRPEPTTAPQADAPEASNSDTADTGTDAPDTDESTDAPSPGGNSTDEPPASTSSEDDRPLIGGRFTFNEPVTDPDGQGWYVFNEDENGMVIVSRDGVTERYRPEELTSERDRQNAEETTEAPETSGAGSGSDEPPADVPSAGAPDEGGDEEQDSDRADDGEPSANPEAGTVNLTPDEVAEGLDAVRPEGSKAPSSMTKAEIRDEIVELMGREMANGGELSGVDRTRLQVLEAEEARRAGRAPKQEPKPKKPAAEPGGLFDVDQPTTRQADSAADLNNPEDRPADEFGTPDMIADAEGRDTSDLRPAQMRNPVDLKRGDRYTDADGRTHTVEEEPTRTGRGRTRIVTDDGEERFYNADAQVRLRYPDEEVPEAPAADAPESGAPSADAPSTTEPPASSNGPTPRYGGEMVAASQLSEGDWVSIDNDFWQGGQGARHVGQVQGITSTNRSRVVTVASKIPGEEDTHLERVGLDPEHLVERLSADNPGRLDTSDLQRRMEALAEEQRLARVRVPDGWRAVEGSTVQPQAGGQYRVATTTSKGVRYVNRRAIEPEKNGDGYWRAEGARRFHPRDIVAVPADALAAPPADGPGAPKTDSAITPSEWGEGDEVITPQHGPGTIRRIADNGFALVDTDSGMRPIALAELRRPGQDTSEADARREAEGQAKRDEEAAWLAAAATSEGVPINTMDGYRLANLDVDAGHGAIMRDGQMVAWIRARGPVGEATWMAQDARGGHPRTPAAAVSEGEGENGLYRSIERAAWTAAYNANSTGDPSNGEGVTRPEDMRGPIMGTALTEAQFREFRDLTERWKNGDDVDLRHVAENYYSGPVSAEQMRHAADAIDREADALDLNTANGRRKEKLYRGLAQGVRWQASALDAMASMPPPGERDRFSRRDTRPTPDAPGSSPDNALGLGGQAAVASDAGPRRFSSVDEVRDRWKRGDLDPAPHADMVLPPHKHSMRSTDADTSKLELSEGGRLAILQAAEGTGPVWSVVAPGSMAVIARAYNRDDALAQARILEGVRDADGNPFPWDAPDAAERARTFRGPNGESLGTVVAQRIASQGNDEGLHSFWQEEAQKYLASKRALGNYYDEWRTRQEADGYTIPLNPLDTQAGDEVTVLAAYPSPYGSRPRTAGVTSRARLEDSARPDPLGQGAMFPFLVDSHWSVQTEETPENTDEQADKTSRGLIRSLRFRSTTDRPEAFRRPRPGELDAANQDGDGKDESSDEQADEDTQEDQDSEERRRQGRDSDADGGAADPEGSPGEGGAGAPGDDEDEEDSSPDDAPENADDEQDEPTAEDEEDDRDRRRRRRRRRNGGGGDGGPGGPGGPGLPLLGLPGSNAPDTDGDGAGSDGARDRKRAYTPHRDVDSLRRAWKNGDGLTPAEDTPERREALAQAADRDGLALSPGAGLVTWPEPQEDGTTLWRFAQARNGANLTGLTLTTDNPEEAVALAGRFEEITGRDGQPFDWHQPWGPATLAQWRDGEGRNLPQALRAVQNDYEQERRGAFTLPEDLTTLSDSELEAAYSQGLSPEDQARLMAEMDRRDGYTDQRVRSVLPDTPPANAEEAERRRRAVIDALGFGDTDTTVPAPATPGNLRREFDALDEKRFQDAMQATGGRLLSAKAEADGIDPREVFSGYRLSNKRAEKLASKELKAWWKTNGRLTYPQYRQREADRVLRAEFALLDEARYNAAVESTNGYFFKRGYKYADLPFNERELFSGGSLSAGDRWREYASEELVNWYDANGGRQTFNQYKQQRRNNERTDRNQFEEGQRRAAEAGETDAAQSFTADDVDPTPAFDPQNPERFEDAAARYGGGDRIEEFAGRAELRPDGSNGAQAVWLDGRRIGTVSVRTTDPDQGPVWDARPVFGLGDDRASLTRDRNLAVANLVVQSLQDGPTDPANPGEDVWDTVTLRLAALTPELPELPEVARDDADARNRYDRMTGTVDAFRDQRSPSGDLRTDLAQARDDFTWLRGLLPDTQQGEGSDARTDLDARAAWASRLLDGLGGTDSDRARSRDDEQQGGSDASSQAAPAPGRPVNTPEGAGRPAAEPEPEAEPEPVGGQPAHWARVEDLVQGDMVRMDGTTKKGKPLQRAGYVYKGPELVDVTRRRRTTQMWRTWITENPDGTGASGNVYMPLNATAARAQAPDDVVPGSPVTGAQSAVQTGNMPERVPSDRNGRALFPGSAVTGVRGSRTQEGTVTGATDTTVSVRWDDDEAEDGISPTSLTVTDGARPSGWTSDGHQVRAGHVVTDTDGALLGPVDEVNGDSVTISTAQGTTMRSAGDLRVTGEVRDTAPDTQPVTDIDNPAAADLQDGDVVVLDLDGVLTTVAVTGTRRDGDRVTVEYADTTTGEIGEIDMDAAAILPRAKGPDGNAPELGPDNTPDRPEDLTVHEPPRPVDPVTGPTVDPDLTEGDRDVIDDHASGPDDDLDAQQAAARIVADLPVTPEQAAALAAQLRDSADPATPQGRAALRAADHLDRAIGRTPPAELGRPRPSNVSQVAEGDTIAIPDDRGDRVRVFRVRGVEDGPGGVRSLLLEDENGRTRRRVVHGAMPLWQLDEARPDAVTPPDNPDGALVPAAPEPQAPSTGEDPANITATQARYLRVGDVVSVPVNGTPARMLVVEAQRSEDRRTVAVRLANHDGQFVSTTLPALQTVNTVDTPDVPGPGPAARQEGASLFPADQLQVGQHLVVGASDRDAGWYTRRIKAVDISDGWVTVELEGVGAGEGGTVRYERMAGGALVETVTVMDREYPATEWFVRNRDRLIAPEPTSAPTPAAPAPAAPDPTPAATGTPDEPSVPVARLRPGSLKVGDVIDAPVSRAGYQFNGHRRLTIVSEPHRNGWWMQLTGIDDDGNTHDFGLHSGRDVNVYERNRPTPALPPSGAPRDPNPTPQSEADRIVADHARTVAARIIDEAIAGTEPPGDIHALREQIAQRLTPEALREARQAARQDAAAALDAAGITGRDRAAAQQALKQTRQDAHTATVRAALRTINDLEPLPDESDEDLAARARDLLSLIPDQIGGSTNSPNPDADADADVARAVAGHADDAVNALLQQLQAAGVDPGDAGRIARALMRQMDGTRQVTAQRIARRIAAASPEAGRQPGLLARIVALLIRLAKRLALLVQAGARKIAERYRSARERLGRLRAFLRRLVRRVREWPESRRLARLHRALDLPAADGESLAARISHWAGLMPVPGRFGQAQRRVTWWNPTTWGQLAAGRLPGRSDRIQWSPDQAADGGPGLTALRHMAALRAAGGDVDREVTRRLAAALGEDFDGDPHGTLQRADDYVATTERRLVNLQAARTGGTLPDDPDLEVEITAARAEAAAARREWADLRAAYAAAVPDAVAATLAEIRDIGPEGNAGIVFGPDTTPDAERAVRGVQRLVPRSWLNTPAARRVTAVDGDEGRYEPGAQRITVADLADDGLGTAGHALAQHLAQHLGDLDAAQRTYWFTQTHTGRPGARRMRPSVMSRILRRQQTQPDTGDTLARSVQSMFNGDWYLDDDLRSFLLGLLATR